MFRQRVRLTWIYYKLIQCENFSGTHRTPCYIWENLLRCSILFLTFMKKKIGIILFSIFLSLGMVSTAVAQRIGDSGVYTDTLFWEAVSKIGSDNESAIMLFKEASQAYLDQKNYKRYTLCLQGLATIYQFEGQVEKEKEYWEKAYYGIVPYAKVIPEYIGTAAYNLASFEIGYGNYSKALILLEQTQKYLLGISTYEDSVGVLIGINKSYNDLGIVYGKLGDYQKAIQIFEVTLEHANNLLDPNALDRLTILNNLGIGNFYIHNYDKAKSYYYQTLALATKANLATSPIYNAHQSLALIYLQEDKLDSVKILLKKIDNLPKKDTLKVYRPGVIHQIKGEYFLKVDSLEKALREFKNQLKWRTKEYRLGYDKKIEFFIQAHQQLAETYQSLGYIDSALYIYQQALDHLKINNHDISTPYPLLGAPILDGKAQAHLDLYAQTHNKTDLNTAFWCYLTADSLIDRVRNNLQNEDSKLFFSQKSRPFYERAIRFCVMMHNMTSDQQYLERAFYFSERNKATLLFQSLQDAGAKLATGLPDTLLEREQNLKADIAFYKNKIFELQQAQSEKDKSQLSNFRQILFDREEAYRMLIKQLETDYPAYYGLKYNQAIMPTRQIQKRLDQDQVLIEFFEGDSSIYLFAISKETIAVYEQEKTALYDEQLQLLQSGLHKPQQGIAGLKSFAQPAYYLYQHLLKPILSDKQYDHLLIIPDGRLSYLPFELLLQQPATFEGLDDRRAGRSFRHLAYLFKEKTVRYAYSGSLLFSTLSAPKAAKHEMAAFAPAYEGSWFLASNQAQAESVAGLFDGDAFTGRKANKENFMSLAGDYRILHLAMHAEPDLYSPLRARLIFAGDETADTASLYAYELYNLKLHAQLIVLAACESGHGKLEKSEGVYSLARAFRYAGCPAIVSSFWKADGRTTTQLMEIFYKKLAQGAHKSESLQSAKLAYLASASNSQLHPYYWGNFVLIGPDDPIGNKRMWPQLLGALALLVVGILFWRSRPGLLLRRRFNGGMDERQ